MCDTYLNALAPEESRVQDHLARMTLEEKFAQLRMNNRITHFLADETLTDANFEERFSEIYDPDRIGCCYLSMDADPVLVNKVQEYTLAHNRLRIPTLVMGESLHGSMMTGATVFPQCIGLGGTFDPELVGQIAEVCSKDSRAFGIRMTYAPNLDISQEPRWGRVEENYGEDPYLTSRMAVAYVKNIQAQGVSA